VQPQKVRRGCVGAGAGSKRSASPSLEKIRDNGGNVQSGACFLVGDLAVYRVK
jgi:hypothetical protein